MIKDNSETEKKYLVIAGFVEVGEKMYWADAEHIIELFNVNSNECITYDEADENTYSKKLIRLEPQINSEAYEKIREKIAKQRG